MDSDQSVLPGLEVPRRPALSHQPSFMIEEAYPLH